MKVRMLYRNPGGTCQVQKATIGTIFPDFLWNDTRKKAGQAHPLHNRPLWDLTPPVPLESFAELKTDTSGHAIPFNGSKEWVGEPQGIWGYSTDYISTREEMESRQHLRQEWQELGRIHVENRTIQEKLGDSLATMAAMLLMAAFGVITLLIGLIVVQSQFGGDGSAALPSGAPLLLLLGLASTGIPRAPRLRMPSFQRPHREPKIYRELVKVIDLTDRPGPRKRRYTLPYTELTANLNPDDCRIAYDLTHVRLKATLVLMVMGYIAAWIPLTRLDIPSAVAMILAVGGALIGMIVGLGWGKELWVRKFGMNPWWLVYVGHASLLEPERMSEEIIVAPVRHTYGRGVDPLQYELIQAEREQAQRDAYAELGYEMEPEYQPQVNTAGDLYQDLQALTHRVKIQVSQPLSEKLRLGAFVGMAACAFISLIFIVALATGG